MELKQRKLIKNTKQLPGFALGYYSDPYENWTPWQNVANMSNNDMETFRDKVTSDWDIPKTPKKRETYTEEGDTRNKDSFDPSKLNPYAAGIMWGMNLAVEGLTFKPKTADELLNDAGMSSSTTRGIGYSVQNAPDAGKVMSDYDKSSISNIFSGNIGKGIGMLFNRNKAKKAALFADNLAYRNTNFNRNEAQTTAMQLENARENGDTRTQLLRAALGKPSYSNTPDNSEIKPRKIATAEGWAYGIPNAKVSNGEVINNRKNTYSFRVPGLKNNKDTVYAYIRPSDRIISNFKGLSDYAHETGDIDGAEDMMKMNNTIKAYKCGKKAKYKCGKLPKYENGRFSLADSLIPNAIGAATSIGLMLDARNQRIKQSNTPYQNMYEKAILPGLASLRVNSAPIIRGLIDAEDRLNRNIDFAGGLSAAQRHAMRMSSLTDTQRNIADALGNIQLQNNSYFTNYANTALQAGAANAQRAMQAHAADLDYYSRAHAAKNNMINQGASNFMNYLQNFSKQYNQTRLYNYMMDQYDDQRKLDREKFEALNKQANTTPSYIYNYGGYAPGILPSVQQMFASNL